MPGCIAAMIGLITNRHRRPHVGPRGVDGQISADGRGRISDRALDGKSRKIVGVSDDLDAVAAAKPTAQARIRPARDRAARSQPYYLDVTHHGREQGRRRAKAITTHTRHPRVADRDDRRSYQTTC